eukprot:1143285-Rhodomonas_salina.2
MKVGLVASGGSGSHLVPVVGSLRPGVVTPLGPGDCTAGPVRVSMRFPNWYKFLLGNLAQFCTTAMKPGTIFWYKFLGSLRIGSAIAALKSFGALGT